MTPEQLTTIVTVLRVLHRASAVVTETMTADRLGWQALPRPYLLAAALEQAALELWDMDVEEDLLVEEVKRLVRPEYLGRAAL